MKTIRTLKQLHAEKARIKQRQAELALAMGHNWAGLKESLRPINMAKDAISSILQKKTVQNLATGELLKNAGTFAFSLVARKAMRFANRKLEHWFGKEEEED